MDLKNAVPKLESVSVPADHRGPNHPHHPCDLEHNSDTRRSALTKKRVLVAGAVIMAILIAIAAAIWGVAIARKPNNRRLDPPTSTIAAMNTTWAPTERYKVYVNATTTECSMTRVPILVGPSPATSTIVPVTPRTPNAPLRLATAATITTTSSLSTHIPSEVRIGGMSITECFFNGAWALKGQCEKHCPAWANHETHCEVSKRSRWVCVSCPSKS